jgi:hypothetical protein
MTNPRLVSFALMAAPSMGGAVTQSLTCAIDRSSAYFTGKTTTDKSTGKLLYEYKCNRNGHLF